MKQSTLAITRRGHAEPLVALALGATTAAFAITRSIGIRVAIALSVCALPALYWTLSRPHRWMIAFFGAAILLPPLPFAVGDSGPHPALLLAAVGVLAGILAIPQWRGPKGGLPSLFVLFTAVLVGSAGLAAIYSGFSIGLGSLSRALLFAIGPYVFLYTLCVPISDAEDTRWTARLLFRFATLAVLFACFDFCFQFPPPAGYEPQFIWLGDLVIRRAQGFFYEASTLGNFCAFFLVMIMAAIVGRRENRICTLWEFGFAGAVFTLALVFSYSRGSLLNVLCAGMVMLYMHRTNMRWILIPALCIIAAAFSICLIAPAFAQGYWLRMEYSILDFSGAPADVLSGRLSNWTALCDFLFQQPVHLFLGIGYKTLPYSEFAGREIIPDNTYLALLVETGVIGLAAFVCLNSFILRAGLRAIRSPNARAKFFGKWITCFWVGELVQMFSGDLITYWRVLPIYFWVLAAAVRETQKEDTVASSA